MRNAMIHLEDFEPQAQELTKKAQLLLKSFASEKLTVGEIDWLLSEARSLLVFSTFQGISPPEAQQTQQTYP